MNLLVSYSLQSDVFFGYDWIILCRPIFTNNHPPTLNLTLETIQALPDLHSWQLTNSSFFYFQAASLL